MLKHFLKTGYRGFKRQKLYSLVNLSGLAIGMFCFLITALYVKDELTFDRWHENADNIFMSSLEMQREDGEKFKVRPSYALLKALKEESSEVVSHFNGNVPFNNHADDFYNGSMGTFKENNIGFSGGNQDQTYLVNTTWIDQVGNMPGSSLEKLSLFLISTLKQELISPR